MGPQYWLWVGDQANSVFPCRFAHILMLKKWTSRLTVMRRSDDWNLLMGWWECKGLRFEYLKWEDVGQIGGKTSWMNIIVLDVRVAIYSVGWIVRRNAWNEMRDWKRSVCWGFDWWAVLFLGLFRNRWKRDTFGNKNHLVFDEKTSRPRIRASMGTMNTEGRKRGI
jgi:hypothetical protein